MALDAYALTTLANFKEVLGITDSSQDTALENTINRASAIVERVLGFTVRTRTESVWFDLDGSRRIHLQKPVAAVTTLALGIVNGLFISLTDTTIIVAQYAVAETGVEITITTAAGTTTTTSLDFDDYPTIETMAAAIDNVTGVACTAQRTGRSVMLRPGGGLSFVQGLYAGMANPDNAAGYALDRDTGILTVEPFWSDPGMNMEDDEDISMAAASMRFGTVRITGPAKAFVVYTHGYATVPYDIEQACLEVATAAWSQRGADLTLTSETLGDASYTRAGGGHDRVSLASIARAAIGSRAVIR